VSEEAVEEGRGGGTHYCHTGGGEKVE